MKSIKLDGVKLLIKTNYAARRSDTPLLSVSSAGYTSLNLAFKETFFKGYNKHLFVQAVNYKNINYLLISKTKKENYYSFMSAKNSGFISNIKGFFKAFGKKGITMRYTLEKVQTGDKSIYAFELKHVAQDLFATVENKEFEIVK